MTEGYEEYVAAIDWLQAFQFAQILNLFLFLILCRDFLVCVRAQVMTRDESTEGWLPLSGGGLAHVSIRKRPRLPDVGHEYIIFGQRISDSTVILSCVINRDLQYFKVMPTFHHWRAGKQRNGLTFQTAADARAFDKGIVRAYDDLIDGEDNRP